MKRKGKVALSILAAVMLAAAVAALLLSLAARERGEKLSGLSDEAFAALLADQGVAIPKGMSVTSAKELTAALEKDPDRPAAFSSPATYRFFEELRGLVKEYDGVTPDTAGPGTVGSP